MNYKQFLDSELYRAYIYIAKAQASIETIGDCLTELGLNAYSKRENLIDIEYEQVISDLDCLEALAEDYKLI